jgi:hypothetical protein
VKLLKQIITPAGHRQLSPKERAQRLGEKLKYKKVLPEDAVKFYLKDNRVYDTSDEYFNFNPDWTFKELESMSKNHGFEPGFRAYNPILLEGFKSPNSHDRSNQKPKRVLYLDRKTKKQVSAIIRKYSYVVEMEGKEIRKKPDFTLSVEERVNYLSELQCCLHHLNYHVNLSTGRLKRASECLALLVEILYTEQYLKSTDWYWFYDHLVRRCYSNNFEGDWKWIARLLQVSSNKIACLGLLQEFKSKTFVNRKGNFSKAQWNDFRIRGKKARGRISYTISLSDPVKHKQFKRGFQHGNSGKNSSQTTEGESDLLISSVRIRDIHLPPSERESAVHFLYDSKAPRRQKVESAEGRYYSEKEEYFVERKESNLFPSISIRKKRNFLEEEKKRIKEREKSFKRNHEERHKDYFEAITPGEVITYKLSTEQLNLKIQECNRKLKDKVPSEIVARDLELEMYLQKNT